MLRPSLARLTLIVTLLATPALAQDAPPEPAMTGERLDTIVTALDPDAQTDGRRWSLTINDVPLLIVTDPANDRMRAMAAVREAEGITPEEMTRMMQANFDAALDARYAIANGTLWSVFIHPLSGLEKNELISGLGQVVNLQTSYGALYSGGALQFGGGDSNGLQRALIDELLEKGEEI